MDWLSWVWKLWSAISSFAGKELGAVIAATIVSLLGILIAAILGFFGWLIDYHRRLSRVRRDIGRDNSGTWPREAKGLWLAAPVRPPRITHETGRVPKVLVVANAKGGVGKTTVAANIAARLAELARISREKPILLIDLDFQGTLSAMSVCGDAAWLPEKGRDSDASYLISGDWQPNAVARIDKSASSIGHTQNPATARAVSHDTLRLITAYYDLAQAENRVMIEWLLGNRKEDIRFRLRKLLWSDAVVGSFSAVIIDCPPRFTTAAIQAFSAATHYLIPTKLDQASREAVLSFIEQIEILRREQICWEEASYLGVVSTMVNPNANVADLRKELNDKLTEMTQPQGRTRCLDPDMDIHENIVFRNAGGRGIAYYGMGEGQNTARVKRAIQLITCHIAREMGLPHSLQKDPRHEVRSSTNVA